MSSLAPVFASIVALMAGAQRPRPPGDSDFLFGPPRASLGVRGGVFLARSDSDVYDFFTDLLTIEKGDFNAPSFGIDVGIALHRRIDVLISLDFSRAQKTSEYREFVEENDLPIVQETKLTILPLTASAKFYLGPRGREVSRYAFVPARVRPYAGAGGGLVWYELEQSGDFVDIVDLSIFSAVLRSSAWGLAAQAFGGAEVGLSPRIFLSFEARYLWADADLSGDFVAFAPIDLSGLRATGGVHVSF